MDKFDLNLITVFLEVYRLRSITQAAESLDLTQPAVSSALKRFRNQVGAELFVREGRGIAPTHAAIQLATELTPLITGIENTLTSFKEFDASSGRTFTVYVTETMLYLLQPRLLNDPDLGQCEVRFKLIPQTQEELLRELSLQKVDLAIDPQPVTSPAYVCETFAEDDMVVLCRKGHPRIQQSLTKEAYMKEQHVAFSAKRGGVYVAEFLAKENIHERDMVCECDSLLSSMSVVSDSDYLTVNSRQLAEKYAERFNLQVLPLPFEARPYNQHLIYHKRKQNNPAHQWLLQRLQAALNI